MKTAKVTAYLGFVLTVLGIIGLGVLIAAAESAGKPRCAVKAGEVTPAFQAQAVDGATIHFPTDFKGKVVLLDFWATWCPDCREELPNVIAAYKKFQPQGFEIVGVSLDQTNQAAVLKRFVTEHGMAWPEIYDGGYWNSAVAVQYGVHAIPCPVLVDGNTGKVLAVGADATGKDLMRALETALGGKK
jgi:peroxiredoxin